MLIVYNFYTDSIFFLEIKIKMLFMFWYQFNFEGKWLWSQFIYK